MRRLGWPRQSTRDTRVPALLLLTLALLLLCSCRTLPPPVVEDGAQTDESTQQQILLGDQAFLTDERFYIRFRRGNQLVHGGGDWSQRIDLQKYADANPPGNIFFLPLQYEQNKPWPEIKEATHPITILGIAEWRQFRNRLFEQLLPKGDKQGLVIHFSADDYFIYLDSEGVFRAVALEKKPGDYRIGNSIASSDLVALGMPILKTFLAERNIREERIAFNTGDTGPYSLPFLFINTKLEIPVFVRLEPTPSGYAASSRALAMLRTGFHIIKSHVTGVAFHPVSSLYRLFFYTADTLSETLRPDWLIALQGSQPPPLADGQGMDLAAWENKLDDMTRRPSSRGTIDYLVDGEAFFTRFADAVSAANKSINLRMYIFDDDDYAMKVADMLKRRANAGVQVKVLLDGFGTVASSVEVQSSLPLSHRAPLSMKNYLEKDSRIRVRMGSNPWMSGDHIKTAVIDDDRAFTGGMNIAREYRFDWHDLMVELKGDIVSEIDSDFDRAWTHAGFMGEITSLFDIFKRTRHQNTADGYPIRLLFTRLHNAEIFHIQRTAIRHARHHIYVENPYFTDDAMLHDLIEARHRGVDVRVIVPLVTDRGPITRNNILAANIMLEHGIRVYIYPGMSHVKAAIFDGWACLGSANWDRWSLQINKEMNIATSYPAAVSALQEQLFEKDFAAATEVTEPLPVRWQDHLIEKFGDYFF